MDVVEWLLDADPSIRWQVMQDITEEPAEVVADERTRVATEGWGARLLGLQAPDGLWDGGDYSPKWTSTTYTLLLLRHLGVDPDSEPVRRATDRVHDQLVMGRLGRPFFAYIGETCITGMTLSLGAYFDQARTGTDEVVEWLLAEQLDDGGWNCQTVNGSTRSSFHTTISVLEGLGEYRRARRGAASEVADAMARGHAYLLDRRLFRSLRTGEVLNPRWLLFSFPPRWHYDVLRALDHLRDVGVTPDERMDEALELVERKRMKDGRWPLQNPHRGREHFAMEDGARRPSQWNTLRALRVLDWAGLGTR